MKIFVKILMITGVLFSSSMQALALDLTNLEANDRSLIVTENGNEKSLVISKGETIKGLCQKACIIKFADGEEFSMAGDEIATIEDGFIFVEDDNILDNNDESEILKAPDTDEKATNDENKPE